MTFEWDTAKNHANEAKHLIRFEEAVTIFEGPVVTFEDDRFDYGERRFITLGMLVLPMGRTVIAVVHTQRGERTRLISARKANLNERRRYHELVNG